jgi:FLVCR family feline leukemia virus subgroup C receptor-related protein
MSDIVATPHHSGVEPVNTTFQSANAGTPALVVPPTSPGLPPAAVVEVGGNARQQQTFTPDWRRWVVLTVFSLFSFSNAVQWIFFSTVVNETEAYFNVSSFQVNMLAMVYAIVFALVGVFGSLILERFGLKRSLIMGNTTNVLGAALRLMAPFVAPNFAMIFTAQFVNCLSQPFILPIPPLIAAEWFPASERTIATSIAAMANNMGVAAGMLLPPIFMEHASSNRQGFINLFLFALILCAVLWVATLLIPAHPQTPPSFAALVSPKKGSPQAVAAASNSKAANITPPGADAEHHDEHHEASSLLVAEDTHTVKGLAKALWRLLKENPSFRLLILSAGIALGSMWTLSTVLAQIMEPFDISESMAGWAGFGSLVGGTVLSFVVGCFVDRKRFYKGPMAILLFLSAVSLSVMLIGMVYGSANSAVLFGVIMYIASGTFQNAAIPVFFEYGLETTFPAPESLSSVLIMVLGNIVCVVLVLVGSFVLGNDPTKEAAIIATSCFTGLIAIGALLVAVMKSDCKRLEYEARMSAENRGIEPNQLTTAADMQPHPHGM